MKSLFVLVLGIITTVSAAQARFLLISKTEKAFKVFEQDGYVVAQACKEPAGEFDGDNCIPEGDPSGPEVDRYLRRLARLHKISSLWEDPQALQRISRRIEMIERAEAEIDTAAILGDLKKIQSALVTVRNSFLLPLKDSHAHVVDANVSAFRYSIIRDAFYPIWSDGDSVWSVGGRAVRGDERACEYPWLSHNFSFEGGLMASEIGEWLGNDRWMWAGRDLQIFRYTSGEYIMRATAPPTLGVRLCVR